MLRKEQKQRAAAWGEEERTAVEVPTNRSQQRLKAIAKPGGGWDEDVHTVARPADAILPAEAFRDSRAATPIPELSPEGPQLLIAPPSRVGPPPLPLAPAAPSAPLAETPASSPSYEMRPGDGAELQLSEPSPRAGLRPGHWVLVCLVAAVCAAVGYAAVTLGLSL